MARLEGRIAKPLSRSYGGNGPGARLVLNVKAAGFATPDLEEDESYTLQVSAERATLSAATVRVLVAAVPRP